MLTMRELSRVYRADTVETTALDRIDLDIADGEFVVIVGPSGCGKSTLLRLIAGLEEPSAGRVLIGGRVIQGLGVGGLTALVQVVIATMVSPRERGRYSGYIGAVFAAATVSGPLIGGLVVDSPLGWRGCFFVGLPFAAAAFVVLQRKLHLPVVRRDVDIYGLLRTDVAAENAPERRAELGGGRVPIVSLRDRG